MLNYQRVNHRHKPHCWEKSFTWWWIDGDQHFWVPNVLLWPDMCGFACALTFLVQVGVEKHYQSYSPQSAHQKTKKTTRNYQKKVCTTLQVILSPYEVLLNVYPPGPRRSPQKSPKIEVPRSWANSGAPSPGAFARAPGCSRAVSAYPKQWLHLWWPYLETGERRGTKCWALERKPHYCVVSPVQLTAGISRTLGYLMVYRSYSSRIVGQIACLRTPRYIHPQSGQYPLHRSRLPRSWTNVARRERWRPHWTCKPQSEDSSCSWRIRPQAERSTKWLRHAVSQVESIWWIIIRFPYQKLQFGSIQYTPIFRQNQSHP